jgi:catalase
MSTVGGEKGSSDTVRDVRGWATKIYTEEGIQDFVFNDLPVFFIRDPIKFPSMNRSHKRHPRTNVPDNSMFWDFHVNNPEGIHALMHLFGTRGIPESLRHINGFGVHTYTLNKADGSYVYVKWHFKPEGGIKTMDPKRAMRLAGSEPDYHVKDLFNAIEKGDYPSWLVYIQVIKPEEVKNAPIDIFDDTYTWPYDKYPLRKIARFTLNKNVSNIYMCCMDLRAGRQTLMACSRTTTSRTLNKLVSPHQIWFLASALQQTPFSRLACSRTLMLIATGSDQITSSSHPIAHPIKSMRHTLEMDREL